MAKKKAARMKPDAHEDAPEVEAKPEIAAEPNLQPTWVFGKDGDKKIVTADEADRLKASGEWADTPAKFND